jgi:hypothetical protein
LALAGCRDFIVEVLSERIDGRAVLGVPDVVPHGLPIRPRGRGVDVVAEELCREVVLAAPPSVPGFAAMDLCEGPDRSIGYVSVEHDPDQLPILRGRVTERGREGVVPNGAV